MLAGIEHTTFRLLVQRATSRADKGRQERNLTTEPSLWLAQLYGTVYQQQFVKQTAKLKTHLFTLCFNE